MRWRDLLAASVLLGVAVLARAAGESTLVFDSQVRRQCVDGPIAAAPMWPSTAASGAGGVVRTRITFEAVGEPPRVDIYTNTGGDLFAAAVSDQLSKYRATCPAALNEQLVQEFDFVASPKVVLPSLLRSNRAQRDRSSCLLHTPPTPDYPRGHRPDGAPKIDRTSYGRVLLRLTYEGQGAPDVVVLHDGGSIPFADTALEFAKQYRLSCSDASAYPVTAVLPVEFRMDGDSLPAFKSLTLSEFLPTIENIGRQHVYFDFTSMGCPFQLAVYPLRPAYDNVVTNRGGHDEDRREFVAWLEGQQIRLPAKAAEALKGSAVAISIPCAVLNLL